jgi:hypothetical protein
MEQTIRSMDSMLVRRQRLTVFLLLSGSQPQQRAALVQYGHASIGDFTIDVYGTKPEWDRNLDAARLAGAEVEKAVQQAIAKQQEQPGIPETVFEIEEKPRILAA